MKPTKQDERAALQAVARMKQNAWRRMMRHAKTCSRLLKHPAVKAWCKAKDLHRRAQSDWNRLNP